MTKSFNKKKYLNEALSFKAKLAFWKHFDGGKSQISESKTFNLEKKFGGKNVSKQIKLNFKWWYIIRNFNGYVKEDIDI